MASRTRKPVPGQQALFEEPERTSTVIPMDVIVAKETERRAAKQPSSISPGDTFRSSWSEKVYLEGRRDILVSTAIEISAKEGETVDQVQRRLHLAMVASHQKNIQIARGGK